MTVNDSEPPNPKRRWYQYTLPTLLIVVVVVSPQLSGCKRAEQTDSTGNPPEPRQSVERHDTAAPESAESRSIRDVEMLLATLGDEDPSARTAALETLVQIGQPAVGPLIGALENEDREVRTAAAKALGELGDACAIEPLMQVVEGDNEHVDVVVAGAEALAKLGDDRGFGLLVTRLKEESRHFPWECIWDEPPLKSHAAAALVRIGEPAVEPLLGALLEKDFNARAVVARTLGRLRDVHAVTPLIELLHEERNYRIIAPPEAFGHDSQAREVYVRDKRQRYDIVQAAAALALGELGDVRAVEPLIQTLDDNRDDVVAAATWALGKLGDPRAVEPLIALLESRARGVQGFLPVALGDLADPRAVQPLARALTVWHVRRIVRSQLTQVFGWEPTTDEEKVLWWIAGNERARLLVDWTTTRRILCEYLRTERDDAFAVNALVMIGKKETVDDIIETLERQKKPDIAIFLLNCGHKRLERAARSWAGRHGYKVDWRMGGSGGTAWGRP